LLLVSFLQEVLASVSKVTLSAEQGASRQSFRTLYVCGIVRTVCSDLG